MSAPVADTGSPGGVKNSDTNCAVVVRSGGTEGKAAGAGNWPGNPTGGTVVGDSTGNDSPVHVDPG